MKTGICQLRQRHLLDHGKGLSPYLIVKDGKAHLSVPFKLHPVRLSGGKVCGVDLGYQHHGNRVYRE